MKAKKAPETQTIKKRQKALDEFRDSAQNKDKEYRRQYFRMALDIMMDSILEDMKK